MKEQEEAPVAERNSTQGFWPQRGDSETLKAEPAVMFYAPVTLEQIVFAARTNVDGFRDKLRSALGLN